MLDLDLTVLFEASRRLNSYHLHRFFGSYLISTREYNEYIAQTPQSARRFRPTDPRSGLNPNYLRVGELAWLVGTYVLTYFSHKKANFVLTTEPDRKRVLYLRGFDYRTIATVGSVNYEMASADTHFFTIQLGDELWSEFEVFKPFSPEDMFWETAGMDRYFHEDYEYVRQICSQPIRSVYLNGNYWQQDVANLLEQMDHVVVYVSSITESLLWELGLLKRAGRCEDTTVVFDEGAIEKKNFQISLQDLVESGRLGTLAWERNTDLSEIVNAGVLRQILEGDFFVVDSDDFLGSIENHKDRIRRSAGILTSDARSRPVPFRFSPAVDRDTLNLIEDFNQELWARLQADIVPRSMSDLDLFVNLLQLRIFTSLLLGDHRSAGRALAMSSGAIQAVLHRVVSGPVGRQMREEEGGPIDEGVWSWFQSLDQYSRITEYAGLHIMIHDSTVDFGYDYDGAKSQYKEDATASFEAVSEFLRRA
jgi:hypothetical protein